MTRSRNAITEQQKRAAELVHRLVTGPLGTPIEELESLSGILDAGSAREMREAIELSRGASIEDLMKVSGTLDGESAREVLDAIDEGCGRVGPES